MREGYFESKKREKREYEDAESDRLKREALFSIDLKKVLSGPEGIRILHRILDFSGVWVSPMKTSSEIYFKVGAASVGLEILDWVQKHDPDGYIRIMKLKLDNEKAS